MNEDRQLYDFFGKMKRTDAEAAPGFESVLRPHRRHLWVWASGCSGRRCRTGVVGSTAFSGPHRSDNF